MNNLHLNLKKKWFDMILSGKKMEEYREIKPYFQLMFCNSYLPIANGCKNKNCNNCNWLPYGFKIYETIIFSNGYSKNRRQFKIELLKIEVGLGISYLGAEPKKNYFILKLGKILSKNF